MRYVPNRMTITESPTFHDSEILQIKKKMEK